VWDVRVSETHTAVIVFLGDRAYKIKKPVDLGFLDFSNVAARRAAAHREVELNRRLAPDVYLGVSDVLDPDGAPCEHIVVMRRMPDDRRLSACVARHEDLDDVIRQIARDITALHEWAPIDPAWSHVGTTTYLSRLWRESFSVLDRHRTSLFDPSRLDRVEMLVQRYLDGRRELFETRIAAGRIRDGHGDLQADDIFVLEDGPRILDCLEFSDELRWGDVLNDIAFLVMDLERIGVPELAAGLLTWQREFTADNWPESLADHYVAYRAIVRAKVACIRHEQGDAEAADRARALFDLAHARLERGRVRLVVVGGLPGTGKSTLAAALAARLPFVVLRTDELRSDGPVGDAGYGEGRYAPENVAANYRSLLEHAGRLLRSGESVVLDGSWSSAAQRELARDLATATTSDLVELCCIAPSTVTAARIADRARRGGDPSEATPAIAERMEADFDPWPTAHRIDTTGALDDAIAAAAQRAASTERPPSGTANG
jgi:aminoglycoside phosphotransferase family enzyme/predicted kinase